MGDSREDFNDYCNLWDQALSDGIFNDTPKDEKPAPQSVLGFGTSGFEDHQEDDGFVDEELIRERAGDPYFDYVNSLLHEGKLSPTPKTPNPTRLDTVGKDQDSPKAAWLNNKVLDEVVKLKQKLYEVECKLNLADAGGKKWSDKPRLQPSGKNMQLEEIRKKLDKLSNSLGLKDEPQL